MERTDSRVLRFSTAAGCAPALLLAHASARADLAARLALFERALFPAGAGARHLRGARAQRRTLPRAGPRAPQSALQRFLLKRGHEQSHAC